MKFNIYDKVWIKILNKEGTVLGRSINYNMVMKFWGIALLLLGVTGCQTSRPEPAPVNFVVCQPGARYSKGSYGCYSYLPNRGWRAIGCSVMRMCLARPHNEL
jgi:hypothetical protein